jgi:predicted nucleic acid-binding protein
MYGITIIILTVVICVQVVSHLAYKRGKKSGIVEGRAQILQENMFRTDREIKAAREANLKIAS